MIYPIHPLYRIFALLCVLLTVVFGWQLRAGLDWGTLFFMGVTTFLTLRYLRLVASRVKLDGDRVRLYMPLMPVQEVEFRQLSAVNEEGRGLKSILLLYHPRAETGLLDADDVRTLSIPAVYAHEELLSALTAQVRP
jgi:hypothetical protein